MENTPVEKNRSTTGQQLENIIFPKLDSFFHKYQNHFFFLSLFFLVLFGILLFDVKVSEGTDDSMYLWDAKKFIEGKAFPNFHGVFYTILLGILMKIVGFHLVFFKAISMVFLIGHQIFFYLALKRRISPFLLVSILLFISLNNSLLYFGSQTYTEALFLFLQSLLFYFFFKYYPTFSNDLKHISFSWGKYLFMGFILFMLSTTRNVGIGAILTIVLVLLIQKKIFPIIYTISSLAVFKFLYSIYKNLVWGVSGSDMASQISISLQKNPYNKALGNEDFSGMLIRLFENIKTYLSNLLLNIIHFRDENYVDTSLFISLIIIIVLISGLILSYRNKKDVLLTIYIYLGLGLSITFISLNQMWGQTRLIIVFVPFILLCFLWPISYLSQLKSLNFLKVIPVILIILIIGKGFLFTAKKAHENKKILAKNLAGNKYYGYTPDLINYLKISEWACNNIPEDKMIGCRKASMSFIYGKGREFYPIFRLPTENVDSIVNQAKRTGNQIVIIDEDKFFKFPLKTILPLKKFLFTVITYNTSIYGLYVLPAESKQFFESSLKNIGLTETLTYDEFKQQLTQKENDLSASLPDKLIEELKKNHVQYIISAELRYNITAKTELTINTVERYMTIISVKYPGILEKIKQVGNKDEEPASIYKVNFEKYHL